MNRTQRLSAVAAGLLGAASIAAGCGSDTEEANDYVDQVNTLQVELINQAAETVSGTRPADPAQVAIDLQKVFEASADDLAAIEPPEDVADLHQQLVGSVSAVGDQIGDAEQAFSSGDPQQAAQAAQDLQSTASGLQTELNGLINEINAQLQG
jgi:hypothetical protein